MCITASIFDLLFLYCISHTVFFFLPLSPLSCCIRNCQYLAVLTPYFPLIFPHSLPAFLPSLMLRPRFSPLVALLPHLPPSLHCLSLPLPSRYSVPLIIQERKCAQLSRRLQEVIHCTTDFRRLIFFLLPGNKAKQTYDLRLCISFSAATR